MINLIGTVSDYSYEGQGVIKIDGLVYFIKDVLSGEIIEFQVIKKHKNYGFGKAIKIIKPSVNREIFRCSYHKCHNCDLKALNYTEQIKFKKQTLAHTLEKAKITGNNIEFSANDKPTNYRNKIVLHFKSEKATLALGYFCNKKGDVVPVEQCWLADERINAVLTKITLLFKTATLSTYDYQTKKGLLKHLIMRVSHNNELLIGVVINSKTINNELRSILNRISNIANVKSVVVNCNTLHNSLLLSPDNRVITPNAYIIDEILGYRFRLSLNSFYQVNTTMLSKLYLKALSLAHLNKDDVVLDAYCGVGTLSLLLSAKVKKVIGVDIVQEAIIDAKYNKELNEVNNAIFICSDVDEYIRQFNAEINCVFLDPPRSGASESFLKTIIDHKIKSIIYISCNPVTLARDISLLKAHGYTLENVAGFDLFSYTHHLECVVKLTLNLDK